MFLRGQTIRRREIPKYLATEEFFSAFSIWKNWNRYGFYEPGGRKNQPPEVVRIIDVFEDERAFYDAEKIAEMREKHGHH